MDFPNQTTLVLAAQAGDHMAFATLIDIYRREILLHCYRMLGSLSDAEDLVQETLLRAWEKRESLSNPAAYRAWLYRIATNLCLNQLARVPRRCLPSDTVPPADPREPLPSPVREPIWLEPFPDDLLADEQSDPYTHAEKREQMTLAFLVALHQLTPIQRAVLLLREVLSWKASEVGAWLELSVPAVNSALQRARHTLHQHYKGGQTPIVLSDPQLQRLLDRYVFMWEQADIPGLVELLREDAWFTMPPLPVWYQGRAAITKWLETTIFLPGRNFRLLPTHANGSPAFTLYRRQVDEECYQLFGLLVVNVDGEQIANVVGFLDIQTLLPFHLPSTLTEEKMSDSKAG